MTKVRGVKRHGPLSFSTDESPQSQYQNVSYLTKVIGSYKKVRTTQG
ncbi:hypothetical protein GGC63_004275 [Paenibacillus sp. OAS669]|nr:hypothetical protein [Paenibacillus sp. OAS669]